MFYTDFHYDCMKHFRCPTLKACALNILHQAGLELTEPSELLQRLPSSRPNGALGPATALLGNLAEALSTPGMVFIFPACLPSVDVFPSYLVSSQDELVQYADIIIRFPCNAC